MASHLTGTSTTNSTRNRKFIPRKSRGGSYGHRRGHHSGRGLGKCQSYHFQPAPVIKDHYGIKMRGTIAECDICCRQSDLFAVGDCMHPICMECGIRLRILDGNEHCPECRAKIDQMKFIEYNGDWSTAVTSIDKPFPHKDAERYKGEKSVFDTFALLNRHVNEMHQFSYCDICVKHLNLLSHERKVYSKSLLRRHMEKGDQDDNSQKGHPQCLFCEKRFLDDAYRYKHLRREHFFCQICDADGNSNYFYSKHEDLIRHYKMKHVVCEEGECKELGIAFRNELELKLHRSTNHGAGKQKLNLDFRFDRAGGASTSSSRSSSIARSRIVNTRCFPRVGVVPNSNIEPPRSDESSFKIVPSVQAEGLNMSLRYANKPGFVVQANDFPCLGSGLNHNSRKVDKSKETHGHVVTTSSEAVEEKNVVASREMPSTSWFIDDDEAFGRSQRSSSSTNQTQNSSTAISSSRADQENNQPTKAHFTASAQPKSLSVAASLLRSSKASNIKAENIFPTLDANSTPTNLPANSVWRNNTLHFNNKASNAIRDNPLVAKSNKQKKQRKKKKAETRQKLDHLDTSQSAVNLKEPDDSNKFESTSKKASEKIENSGSPESSVNQEDPDTSKKFESISKKESEKTENSSSPESSVNQEDPDTSKKFKPTSKNESEKNENFGKGSLRYLPPPPGIISMVPPGLMPPPGLGPPPGFQSADSFRVT
uniref:RING-type domain-containing protein n=1 Tax=Syphacia muris TaxID=451379 RepID=A0A0N5ARC3_9BILA